MPFGRAACYFAWPQPRTYIVINSVSVVRLPERTPVSVHAVSLRSAVDDLYWAVSMDLSDPAHLALVKPSVDGLKVVEITVNGYVWTAIIESYTDDRQFPARRVTVSGRSQSALLDEPYALQRALVQSADRQAQQLIDDELELTGFSADYGTVTWLVPGGAWHYTASTPIAAIREIAAAAGAVVQTHPWDQVLQVRPRYPVSPWEWTSTAPDVQIQDDIILRIAAQLESRPLYNYVLVSGDQVGVSDPVIRTGSAGDVRAAQVVDRLITQHDVAAERGRNVISDRGEQSRVSIDIPLFAASVSGQPGLVPPLQLVEVIEPVPWKGLAIACEIRVDVSSSSGAALTTVRQSLTIERHMTDAN